MVASRKTRSLSVATLGVALLLLGASRAAALPIELAPEMNDTMAGNLTVGNLTEMANDSIAGDENLGGWVPIGRRSLAQRRGVPNLAPEMNDTAGNMTVMNETVVNCTETDTDCINLSFKRIGKGIEKGAKSFGPKITNNLNSVGHFFSGRRSLRKLLGLTNLAPEMNDTMAGNLTEITNDTIADDFNFAVFGGEWRIP